MRGRLNYVLPLFRSWAAYAMLPAAGIITAPILAHALGPEGRGQLAGVLQPMTLASAIAALGVPSAVTYYIGQRAATERVMKFANRMALAMTIIVGLGLLLYSSPVARQIGLDRGLILLIWIAFLPSVLIAIRRAHLQGLRRYKALDLERLLAAAFRVGVVLLLWLAGVNSVIIVAAAYMLAGLGASVILRLPSDSDGGGSPVATSPLSGRTFASYSLLSSFGTIAAAMSARLDQAIMPAVVSAVELGYYSVAVSVAEISTIITMVAARNVFAEASGGFSLGAIIKPVLVSAVVIGLMIGAIMIALPYLVPIIFGQDFSPAIELIQVLLLGSFVAYWVSVASAYLSGIGRPGLSSIGQASAVLVTAGLFWLAWSRMDALAVAWISVWSQVAALVTVGALLVWMTVKHQDIPPVDSPNQAKAD